MRKKVLTLVGVVIVLAIVLSLTAFAEEGAQIELTDYNLITILHRVVEMILTAVFGIVDKVYVLFQGLSA